MSRELPIYLSLESEIPIYLQIVHQLTYLIYSRQLSENAKLPPVRGLAEQLKINPNTVAQAYSELQSTGLVDAQRGRGTFVKPLSVFRDSDWALRRELLSEEVSRLRGRAHALGFSDADIQQQLFGVLHRAAPQCEVLFVGHTDLSADKYATALTSALKSYGVVVRPLSLEALATSAEPAAASLALSYYVVTFVSLKQRVEDLLLSHSQPHRVLGISLEITETTTQRIAALAPGLSLCVFTQERYQAIALNVLQSHSVAAHKRIAKVLDTSPEPLARSAFDEADLVIHTFGVSPLLDGYGVPQSQRLELGFRVSDDSLGRLKSVFANRLGGESKLAAR